MKNNLNQSIARSFWFEGALAGCSAALSNINQSKKNKIKKKACRDNSTLIGKTFWKL